MSDKKQHPILLSSSPHFFTGGDVQKIMLAVIMALVPVSVYGVVLFGLPALLTILVSIVSAVASEALFQLVTKQELRIRDCSSVITGLLLALILPPSTPLWMTAFGAIFAVVVAKEFFGGLGANPFNPALIGRAVMLMSFPLAITTWHKPFTALIDATTTATPLNLLKQSGEMGKVIEGLNVQSLNDAYLQLFLGNRSGCIGESSILLILVGAAFLVLLRVIDLRTPLTMIGSAVLVGWALGVDPMFSLLSGGLVFGAFFMATDYSTTPITPMGKIIFGLCTGVIIALIRKFGGYPEGVTYAILIMNAVSPFLDKLRVKKYGWVKKAKPLAAPVKEGGAK